MTGRRPPVRSQRRDTPGVVEGSEDARGLRFGIAVSRFNETITNRLLEAAVDALYAAGVEHRDLTIVRVSLRWETA